MKKKFSEETIVSLSSTEHHIFFSYLYHNDKHVFYDFINFTDFQNADLVSFIQKIKNYEIPADTPTKTIKYAQDYAKWCLKYIGR